MGCERKNGNVVMRGENCVIGREKYYYSFIRVWVTFWIGFCIIHPKTIRVCLKLGWVKQTRGFFYFRDNHFVTPLSKNQSGYHGLPCENWFAITYSGCHRQNRHIFTMSPPWSKSITLSLSSLTVDFVLYVPNCPF